MVPRRQPTLITPNLRRVLRRRFELDATGIHGPPHWARVRANGLIIAERTGASADVVELFAYIHDSCRQNEYSDRGHGGRSADYVAELRASVVKIADEQAQLLIFACRHHSDGMTDADITVQACWDADRLDLGRVGIRPHPDRLCTAAARDFELLDWAYQRSLR